MSNGMCHCGVENIDVLGAHVSYDGKCKERCDTSSDCTGYSKELEDEFFCQTYTSIWICGNDVTGGKCYKKEMGMNTLVTFRDNLTLIRLKNK